MGSIGGGVDGSRCAVGAVVVVGSAEESHAIMMLRVGMCTEDCGEGRKLLRYEPGAKEASRYFRKLWSAGRVTSRAKL